MRKEVRVAAQLVDVKAVLLPVSQTAADKRLRRTRKNSVCLFHTFIYIKKNLAMLTLASLLATGLAGNCTSVAFRMVFS